MVGNRQPDMLQMPGRGLNLAVCRCLRSGSLAKHLRPGRPVLLRAVSKFKVLELRNGPALERALEALLSARLVASTPVIRRLSFLS